MDEPHIPASIMGAVREIESIRKEVKRLNARAKFLRDKEVVLKSVLKEFMETKEIPKIQSVTLKSVTPRAKRKPMKEKVRDACLFLEEQGIDDPKTFWSQLQQTQKASTVKNDTQEEDEYH
jgi:hypothetical protein